MCPKLLAGCVCLLAVATASAQPAPPGAPDKLPIIPAPMPAAPVTKPTTPTATAAPAVPAAAPAVPATNPAGLTSAFDPAADDLSNRLAAATAGNPWAMTGPRAWATAEYLLWWVRPINSPDLIQTVPSALAQTNTTLAPGAATRVFPDFPNQGLGVFSGVRASAGWNFDRFGVEGSYLYLPQNTQSAALGSNGTPVAVAVPYVSAGTGQPTALFASLPNQYSGSVAASIDTRLWGAEGSVRLPFYAFLTSYTDALVGFRYLELQENLNVATHALFPDGSTADVRDAIHTRNQFYGGQVGLVGRLGGQERGFGMDVTGKLAVGSVQQRVEFVGSNTLTTPGLPPSTEAGGLYARDAALGVFTRDKTAMLYEQNVNFTYNFNCRAQVYVGYSIIWLSSVQRPGEAIDPVVNDSRTRFVANTTPSPINRPAFQFNGNDFWAQGITFGLKLQY